MFFSWVSRATWHRLLSIADILLLPSENESFGLVALEAMACEVPVIATRIGGLPEVVEHEEDGFLLGLGDVAGNGRGQPQAGQEPSICAMRWARLPASTRYATSAPQRSSGTTKSFISKP